MKRLLLITLFTSCTTVAPDAAQPYRFPSHFFVEQKLKVTTPEGSRPLLAQLERGPNNMQLVLMDRLTTVILARVALPKGQAPVLSYLSPHVPTDKLPLMEIAEAVRFLYEQPQVQPEAGRYRVDDPAGRWAYSWSQLREGEGCSFPVDLALQFKDPRYAISITLSELDCKGGSP